MHDKVVRRRRAVLALLVALSLLLLTAYFGESSSGGLHATQRGALEVLAPIQEGANKALKPARDLFGWFGDTLDAQDERDRLATRARLAARRGRAAGGRQPRAPAAQAGCSRSTRPAAWTSYDPVQARVYQRSPSTWYQTATINKGSSDGVAVDDPVVNGQGLVGKVKSVSDGNAVVMLLTDQDFGVSALAAQARRARARSRRSPAASGDLLFDLVDDAEDDPQGRPDRHRRHVVAAPAVRLPALDPDRHGQADRERRGRAGPPHPRGARRRPAAPRHRPGADRARRQPPSGRDAAAVTLHPRRHRPHRRCSACSQRCCS